MTGALIGTIVAQFFSASEGVGILMQRFAFRLNMDGSFAALIVMSLYGAKSIHTHGIYGLQSAVLEKTLKNGRG